MSEITDNGFNNDKQKLRTADSVWLKSVRLTINLVTNILICLTVFVCFLFSCNSEVTLHNLHIICCVLGYQFFMCQGILILSKYNSWSIFIKRRHRKHTHWVLQVIAAALVIAGTCFSVYQKETHFASIHGIFGLAAVLCCLASLLNGILAMWYNPCISVFWVKLLHYTTGFASMFLASASLCAAFQYRFFKDWTGNGDVYVPLLTSFTWMFTILVSLDFWIETYYRIRNKYAVK